MPTSRLDLPANVQPVTDVDEAWLLYNAGLLSFFDINRVIPASQRPTDWDKDTIKRICDAHPDQHNGYIAAVVIVEE